MKIWHSNCQPKKNENPKNAIYILGYDTEIAKSNRKTPLEFFKLTLKSTRPLILPP